MPKVKLSQLRYDRDGLVPVIVQDEQSKAVLMMAYANQEAVDRTLASGNAWFWSRSRGQLWMKGETSGNAMRVREVLVDCDEDALLYLVQPLGPACHTGQASCFYRQLEKQQVPPKEL